MSICALCGEDVFYHTHQMQAHHIKPKWLFESLALDLSNGVMLCASHHQGIVHNHNAASDVRNNSVKSGWRHFLTFFNRWNSLLINSDFNYENQNKLPYLNRE